MKRRRTPDLYPDQDYIRDHAEWHQTVGDPRLPWHNRGHEAAEVVFSLRYQNDPDAYRYRMNRFVCILDAVYTKMPQLVHDRIALPDGGAGAHMPEHLYLALLAWYRRVPEHRMKQMPDPDWPWVLEEYDRLDAQFDD